MLILPFFRIATIMSNRSDDPGMRSTLVICPVALLDQWKLEIELKTNDALRCLIYHGNAFQLLLLA